MLSLLVLGLPLIAAYFLLGSRHSYLLYLGIFFVALAMSLFTPSTIRWLPLLLAIAAFLWAVVDGVRASQTRLLHMREDLRTREEAFAEMVQLEAAREKKLRGKQNGE